MVTFTCTDNDNKTVEMIWSTVNPITGKTNTEETWNYYYLDYSYQYNQFKIKITVTDSDKDTYFYVALQSAGGKAGANHADVGAGGGGGGQLISKKFLAVNNSGDNNITMNVGLADIGGTSTYTTEMFGIKTTGFLSGSNIRIGSNNTTYILENGKDGGDAKSDSYDPYNGYTNGADGAKGGNGANTLEQSEITETDTYVFGGGGGNASGGHPTGINHGTDGTPGIGYNSATSGSVLEYEAADPDTTPAGSSYFTFADGTSALICSGGQAGVVEHDGTLVTYPYDAQAGNTPWFLLYYKV